MSSKPDAAATPAGEEVKKPKYSKTLKKAFMKQFNKMMGKDSAEVEPALSSGSSSKQNGKAAVTKAAKGTKDSTPSAFVAHIKHTVNCENCANIRSQGLTGVYCSERCSQRQRQMSERMNNTVGYNGATLIKTDNVEFRKLHSKARWGRDDEVKRLLSAGCPIDLADEHGNTALIVAVQNDHKDLVEYLIEKGASINNQNLTGNTALHFARTYAHEDIAQVLLKHDADATITNSEGLMPDQWVKAGKVQ